MTFDGHVYDSLKMRNLDETVDKEGYSQSINHLFAQDKSITAKKQNIRKDFETRRTI